MPIDLNISPGFPRYAKALLETAAGVLADPAPDGGPILRAGAVVQTSSGREFTAVTIADPPGQCAEEGAIRAADSDRGAELRILAVVSDCASDGSIELPCGSCRQLLWESVCNSGRDIEIYCADRSVTRVVLVTASELLPFAGQIPTSHER